MPVMADINNLMTYDIDMISIAPTNFNQIWIYSLKILVIAYLIYK